MIFLRMLRYKPTTSRPFENEYGLLTDKADYVGSLCENLCLIAKKSSGSFLITWKSVDQRLGESGFFRIVLVHPSMNAWCHDLMSAMILSVPSPCSVHI